MTVSPTHDASAIATTASAAVPPSERISAPTSVVAGWPAAIPGLTWGSCQVTKFHKGKSVAATLPRDRIRGPSVPLPSRGAGTAESPIRRSPMSLTKEAKLEVIEKHGRSPADTGSAEVQIA